MQNRQFRGWFAPEDTLFLSISQNALCFWFTPGWETKTYLKGHFESQPSKDVTMRRTAVNDVGIHHKDTSEFISALSCYTWRKKNKEVSNISSCFLIWHLANSVWLSIFLPATYRYDEINCDRLKQHLKTVVDKTAFVNSYKTALYFYWAAD